jgi:exopolyphosphatase/guanosine-5'-triphosphate,3'-diphosphate pyrophosphatase
MNEPSRRAVIDLGTNTFHLLIATVEPSDRIEVLYRERIFVKLAKDGIETIGPEPFQRGMSALRHFARLIGEYEVTQVTAIGTAALRTASNGELFIRTAELETGIAVRLISGDVEADLITAGVLAALPPLTDSILIMDIGGGSTEFIIASAEGVHWRESFPVGVAVLAHHFHRQDPIGESELRELEEHLSRQLSRLATALAEYPATQLVGAAGTFDALVGMLGTAGEEKTPTSHRLPLEQLARLHFSLLTTTEAERLAFPGLPPERADLIVVALVLLRFVLRLAGIERVTVSDYAMKEGILLSETLLRASASDRNPGSPAA